MSDEGSERLKELADEAPTGIEEQPEEIHEWQLVVLRIGDRWFGLHAENVREVVVKGFVTRLPHAPSYIEGLTLVHGRIVPVVSLGELIGGIGRGESGAMLPRLVVVEHEGSEMALVSDEARGVVEADPVAGSPHGEGAGGFEAIVAETEWEGHLVAVLDAARLVEAAARRRAG